nr:hypothetical protein [Natronosalvus vescus]
MERLEFLEVGVNLADVTVDEPGCLANTLWFVLDYRPEELQVFWTGDTMDIVRIVEDHLEMRLWYLTAIERLKGIS